MSSGGRGCSLPDSNPWHLPGEGVRDSTGTSSVGSFPEIVSALHCLCIMPYLVMKSSPQSREKGIMAVFMQRSWRLALQPQVWLRLQSMVFALLLPPKAPEGHGGHSCSLAPAIPVPPLGCPKPWPSKEGGLGGNLGPQTPRACLRGFRDRTSVLELCPWLGSLWRGGW